MSGEVTDKLPNPVEGWVTLNEAGEIVNRDISTIRYWVKSGKISCYRIGSSVIRIVNVEEVKRYSEKAVRIYRPTKKSKQNKPE